MHRKPSAIKRAARTFCSRHCVSAWAESNPRMQTVVCQHCGDQFTKDRCQIKWYPTHYCSPECRYAGQVGSGNKNWRDGNGVARGRERANAYSNRDKLWSAAVRERDGGKCVRCGSTRRVHAHHIVDWRSTPELRLDVANGESLCHKCHMGEHSKRGWFVSATDAKAHNRNPITPYAFFS